MIKKITAFLFALMLTLSFTIPAFASSWVSTTETLTDDELAVIDEMAQSIKDNYGYNVYFTYSTEQGSAGDLAEQTLDANNATENSISYAVTYDYYALVVSDDLKYDFDIETDRESIWEAIGDYESEGVYNLTVRFYADMVSLLSSKAMGRTAPAPGIDDAELYGIDPQIDGNDGIMLIDGLNTDGFHGTYLIDEAGILREEDAKELDEELADLSAELGIDVVVLTKDHYTSSLMACADDFYDYNGYADDGVLLLINTVNGGWTSGNCWISTKGYGITAFTDSGIQYIGSNISGDLEKAEYKSAINSFMGYTEDFVEKARDGKPFEWHQTNYGTVALIALVIGLIGAFVITKPMKDELKSVNDARDANNYLVNGSLVINQAYDQFLYSNVTKSAKAESKSSGGSSTHTSSSGSTHGGGGF